MPEANARKRDDSRRTLFETLERPALRPLPAERYQFGDWHTARANIDYHVAYDRHCYSVPYQLTGQELEVRGSATTVQILHRGVRVASHARSTAAYEASTVNEHRPTHQRYLEWTPSRRIERAAPVGPATAELSEKILASRPHPEMGYRPHLPDPGPAGCGRSQCAQLRAELCVGRDGGRQASARPARHRPALASAANLQRVSLDTGHRAGEPRNRRVGRTPARASGFVLAARASGCWKRDCGTEPAC